MRAQYIAIPYMRRDVVYGDTFEDACYALARAIAWLTYATRQAFGGPLWMRAD